MELPFAMQSCLIALNRGSRVAKVEAKCRNVPLEPPARWMGHRSYEHNIMLKSSSYIKAIEHSKLYTTHSSTIRQKVQHQSTSIREPAWASLTWDHRVDLDWMESAICIGALRILAVEPLSSGGPLGLGTDQGSDIFWDVHSEGSFWRGCRCHCQHVLSQSYWLQVSSMATSRVEASQECTSTPCVHRPIPLPRHIYLPLMITNPRHQK